MKCVFVMKSGLYSKTGKWVSNSGYVINGKPDIVLETVNIKI